jgi:hypothetical protein
VSQHDFEIVDVSLKIVVVEVVLNSRKAGRDDVWGFAKGSGSVEVGATGLQGCITTAPQYTLNVLCERYQQEDKKKAGKRVLTLRPSLMPWGWRVCTIVADRGGFRKMKKKSERVRGMG